MFVIDFALPLLHDTGRRHKPAPHRPALEILEDRCLLSGITAGPDGNLWVADGIIRRFALDGTATDFTLPTPTGSAVAITAGPDGNLWFTEADRSLSHFFDGKVGRITPDGTITEFDIPTLHAMYPGSPGGIAAGPDGNLWFTEPLAGKIGRITPDGALTEFPVPTGSADPDGITAGPDGNLWFTEAFQFQNGNKVGRITPDGGITEFPLPTPNSLGFTEEITAGPDGNLWYTKADSGQLGEFVVNDTGRASGAPRTATVALETASAGAPRESLQPVVAQQPNMASTATGVSEGTPPPSLRSGVPDLTTVPNQFKPDRAAAADAAWLADLLIGEAF